MPRKMYPEANVKLGANITAAREALGMKTKTVCKRIGISMPRYSQWETGYG